MTALGRKGLEGKDTDSDLGLTGSPGPIDLLHFKLGVFFPTSYWFESLEPHRASDKHTLRSVLNSTGVDLAEHWRRDVTEGASMAYVPRPVRQMMALQRLKRDPLQDCHSSV